MVLAIWVAARLQILHASVAVLIALIVAAAIAAIFRWLRGAKVADVCDGRILRAFFLARFTVTPAVFLLGLASAIFWLLGSSLTATLWLATQYALVYGVQAILLTSIALDVALGLKGPHRDPPLDS